MLYRLPLTPPGFPRPEEALAEPGGLLAVGGDLTPDWLLTAYAEGIFPWFNSDREPILWWSPDPRAVLEIGSFRCSGRLRRRYRNSGFHYTLDRAFHRVVEACAAPRLDSAGRLGGTWITPAMRRAYGELHQLGFAHSLEVWHDGELAGGLYGVSLGRLFFAESMFTQIRDSSKLAMLTLETQLGRWGFALIDCQVMNPHLGRLGVRDLDRASFLVQIRDNEMGATRRGSWTLDADLTEPGDRQAG